MSIANRTPSQPLRAAVHAVAAVSGALCLVVSALVAATYIQTTLNDPLDSPALNALRERYAATPDDTLLRDGIRELDLQVRRAYFGSRDQIATGILLALVAAAVCFAALHADHILAARLPRPGQAPDDAEWRRRRTARRAVTGTAGALLLLTLWAGLATRSRLTREWAPAHPQTPSAQATTTTSPPPPHNTANAPAPDGAPAALPEPEPTGTPSPQFTGTPTAEPVADVPSLEEQRRHWPAFRGVGGLGIAAVTNAPLHWDGTAGRGIAWKVKTPKLGFSSPIVWGERIFLTGADKTGRYVYGFNRADGTLAWTRPMPKVPETPAKLPEVTDDTGYAAPTMTTDGRRAYAMFATGEILAVDFNGNVVWARGLGVPDNHYGHSSSLVMHEGLIFIQFDHAKGARLLALDATTGRTVWDQPRKVEICWASPIVANTGDRWELILAANPFVAGYAPRTGEPLWQVECLSGEVGPSPAYADGKVFAANEYAVLAAISLAETSVVWQVEEDLPNTSSPLAAQGLVFTATADAFVACFDAADGKRQWEHEFDEGFFASPILVGDRVYLMDKKGVMHVFEAAREFRSIAESPLGEPSVCTPAFVGHLIFVRGLNHLYCIKGDDA